MPGSKFGITTILLIPNPPNGQICMTFIARNYRAEVKRATKRTTQRITSSESTNGLIFFTKRGQNSTELPSRNMDNTRLNTRFQNKKLSVSLSVSLDTKALMVPLVKMNSAQARGGAPPIDCASGRIGERRISARMGASVSLVRHLLTPNPLNKRT